MEIDCNDEDEISSAFFLISSHKNLETNNIYKKYLFYVFNYNNFQDGYLDSLIYNYTSIFANTSLED